MTVAVMQARVVEQAELTPGTSVVEIALFNADGTPWTPATGDFTQAASIANVTTADASDLATAQTLVNALKGKVNETLNKLKAAGIVSDAI